jgi:hypothetical protein
MEFLLIDQKQKKQKKQKKPIPNLFVIGFLKLIFKIGSNY